MTDITRKFQAGETIPCWAEFLNWVGTHVSPDQHVKVTIKKPDGTELVASTAMSEDATGYFVYYYASVSTLANGWYTFMAVGTDGTGASERIQYVPGGFEVEGGTG